MTTLSSIDVRFSFKKYGHLIIEAKNFLVDGYLQIHWVKVWDSLQNNLDFTEEVAPRNLYKLILTEPIKNASPSYNAILELYDEIGVLIWFSKRNLCKNYFGYYFKSKQRYDLTK